MYIGLLHLHSFLRYVLLILLLYAVYRAVVGLMQQKTFDTADQKTGLFLMISAHTQLLIGLGLYFISPMIQVAMVRGMAFAMKDAVLRFWTTEHSAGMIAAIALITAGRIVSKKTSNDRTKHMRSAIFYIAALLLILVLIPWPFTMAGSGRGWF